VDDDTSKSRGEYIARMCHLHSGCYSMLGAGWVTGKNQPVVSACIHSSILSSKMKTEPML